MFHAWVEKKSLQNPSLVIILSVIAQSTILSWVWWGGLVQQRDDFSQQCQEGGIIARDFHPGRLGYKATLSTGHYFKAFWSDNE